MSHVARSHVSSREWFLAVWLEPFNVDLCFHERLMVSIEAILAGSEDVFVSRWQLYESSRIVLLRYLAAVGRNGHVADDFASVRRYSD